MARQFPNEVQVFVLQERHTVYRGCFGGDDQAVLASLRSNYEIRREPPHPADLHATVLHMALSTFEDRGTIVRMAGRRPDRMGSHVAELVLEPGHGVCIANTGSTGHWSVWGVPAQLMEFVTDVEGVS